MATVTPVVPSFARGDMVKRPSSVENISSRSSEGSDEEYVGGGSPGVCPSSAAFASGLNYIALNLLENRGGGKCDVGFKGGINGFHRPPYVCLGFKETATTAKGEHSTQT